MHFGEKSLGSLIRPGVDRVTHKNHLQFIVTLIKTFCTSFHATVSPSLHWVPKATLVLFYRGLPGLELLEQRMPGAMVHACVAMRYSSKTCSRKREHATHQNALYAYLIFCFSLRTLYFALRTFPQKAYSACALKSYAARRPTAARSSFDRGTVGLRP